MEVVVVAFESVALCRKMSDLLESGGMGACIQCQSGDQVRRALSNYQTYCIVSGYHLSDGLSEWIYEDMPPTCSMLMIAAQHQLSLCSAQDMVKLPTPISKAEVIATVRLLIQFGHRLERLLRPKRSANEQEVVERAKAALIEKKGMTEEEAHRCLQKRSMDAGKRIGQTARQLLAELE